MASISYRQVHHSEGDSSDTAPLLQRTAKVRPSRRAKAPNYEIHQKQRPAPEILTQPPRERTETTIRLRFYRQLPTPEAWWIPRPAQASSGEKENEASANHRQPKKMGDGGRVQREWIKRLRPIPHRRY
ncbi:hypothetical protein POX_c04602 [Penicillium oxalicum]|uniref:hypothetical protein n=1 Tax=Penicillium oxalicum TaxID=69781 RepID=UPI0020B6CD27|nr:hypothetical protein POX_c04602 [Penicillium oxalicum]KAI2791726.1 hypothetical protein POX_c04602 [Penicillium oxalicum]